LKKEEDKPVVDEQKESGTNNSNFLVARLKREKNQFFWSKIQKKVKTTAILGQKTIKNDISDLATRKFENKPRKVIDITKLTENINKKNSGGKKKKSPSKKTGKYPPFFETEVGKKKQAGGNEGKEDVKKR